MKLPSDPTGKGAAAYLGVIYLLAYLPVAGIVWMATGLNIGDTQVECSANPWTYTAVLLSITAIALVLHMVVGYYYFQSIGEGPYGPVPKPRSRKRPKRTRLLPYISNGVLFPMMLFPGVFFLLLFRCP